MKLREHRHSVTKISLCAMRITICQNELNKEHPPKVEATLQVNLLTPSGMRIKISRKRKVEEAFG